MRRTHCPDLKNGTKCEDVRMCGCAGVRVCVYVGVCLGCSCCLDAPVCSVLFFTVWSDPKGWYTWYQMWSLERSATVHAYHVPDIALGSGLGHVIFWPNNNQELELLGPFQKRGTEGLYNSISPPTFTQWVDGGAWMKVLGHLDPQHILCASISLRDYGHLCVCVYLSTIMAYTHLIKGILILYIIQ